MRRVVVLGRGGAGKSTVAERLGRRSGLPVVELDAHFWPPDLRPLDRDSWTRRQQDLAADDQWIMEGDLGRHDVLMPRLARADTVLVLDFSLPRCVWNAARRSPERWDFWWWVLTWRAVHRRRLLGAIHRHAPHADVAVLRSPRAVEAFVSTAR